MSPVGTMGGEVSAPTRTQETLDTWFHVQNRRRLLLRRWHISARYSDNSPTPQPAIMYSNRRGAHLRLADYIRYNVSAQIWVNSPAPINENEMWMIAGVNSNGIKPYGHMKELIPIVERLRNLQAGGILLNGTNMEWHKWEHRENSQQVLRNTFSGANVEYSTSKEKIESRVKPGVTFTSAVGDWSQRVVRTGHDNTGCGRWLYITLGLK
jgi:hypothetical protein